MSEAANWQKYHDGLQRDTRLAEIWVRDAVKYLRSESRIGADSTVLDFGCGYFDLGAALAPHVAVIDGLEIDPYSIALAQARVERIPGTSIYSGNEEVPAGRYDLILANSVFQYLPDDDAILDTLKSFRGWLKPDVRGEVLLIDLIPVHYSPARDALRSMWVATREFIPLTMMRFLWNAATNPHGRSWCRIDPNRLAELAREAGFHFKVLPRNLTPSRQRYTCSLVTAR